MQRWWMHVALAGVVALATPWAAAQEAGTKIGFVNVKQVLDKYTRTDHEQKRLREQRGRYQKKIEDLADKKAKLETQIEILVPGTVKFEETKRQILELEQNIKFEREWSNYRIGSDYAKATIEVYQDLIRGVKTYAEKNGYALVLKIEDDEIKSDSLVEVNVRINGRAVLFHDPKNDITQALVEQLNAEWAKIAPADGGGDKPGDGATAPGNGGGAAAGGTGDPSGAGGGDKKPGNG